MHMMAYKILACQDREGSRICQVAKMCSVKAIEFVTTEQGDGTVTKLSGPVTVAVWYKGSTNPLVGKLFSGAAQFSNRFKKIYRAEHETFKAGLKSLDGAGAVPCAAY